MFQTNVVEKIKAGISCPISFFSEKSAVCDITWKNKVQPNRQQMTIYEGNSISKLQIQVATYVFELSAGNCHR